MASPIAFSKFTTASSKLTIVPDSELSLISFSRLVALLLAMLLLLGSVTAWIGLLLARLDGKAWFADHDAPRAAWNRFAETTVLALVLILLSLHLAPKFDPFPPRTDPDPLTTQRLISHVILTGGIALLLIAILTGSRRPLAEYGMTFKEFGAQVQDGITGYLLALLPTSMLMLLTSPFRNQDTRNALLTLLSESSDFVTVVLIGIAAVVLAPLYEEMMFRVVLQGWLSSMVRPGVAIPIVAVAFGAIHGFPDGIALLPLAGILGYVFHRRHSYVSVVVIHGLFNGTMLTLALLIQE